MKYIFDKTQKVRIFAVIAPLCFVSGCGGSSTPSSEVPAGLMSPVRAVYSNDNFDGSPLIAVSWHQGSTPPPGIMEYHVFRDDVLVGTRYSSTPRFADGDLAGGGSFPYRALETIDGKTSLSPRSQTFTPLTLGVPHVYRVTVLYKKVDGRIIETLVGVSDPVTLPIPEHRPGAG